MVSVCKYLIPFSYIYIRAPFHIFFLPATSTAALGNFGDSLEDEDGGSYSARTEQLVDEFWYALARTGVQITTTDDALL